MCRQLLTLLTIQVVLAGYPRNVRAAPPVVKSYESSHFHGAVEVQWAGHWWPARVIQVESATMYRVQWSDVGAELVVHHSRLRSRALERTNIQVCEDLVEVEREGDWWPAVVISKSALDVFVHFEGWGNSWNQWVRKSRVRQRRISACGAMRPAEPSFGHTLE